MPKYLTSNTLFFMKNYLLLFIAFVLSSSCSNALSKGFKTVNYENLKVKEFSLNNINKQGYFNNSLKYSLSKSKGSFDVNFQHAFFAGFLGYSDGNFALSYGAGYAPRVAFVFNNEFSLNLGTNVQVLLPSGSFSGIGISLPLLIGLAYGAPASQHSNNTIGAIFNLGLSQVLIEDSPDVINFFGPTAEIGFAFMEYMQIRLTMVSSFDNLGSELFFSAGLGIEI